MIKKVKKGALIAAYIILLIILFYVLKSIGFKNIYENIMRANKIYLIIAFIAGAIYFLVWNYKFYKMLKTEFKKKVKYWKTLPISFAGSFFNNTTPGAGVGGEPIKAYYCSLIYKKSKSKIFAILLIDKAINNIVFMVFLIPSILFAVLFVKMPTTVKIILGVVVGATVLLFIGAYLLVTNIKRKHLKRFLKMLYHNRITSFFERRFKRYRKFESYVFGRMKAFHNTYQNTVKNSAGLRLNFFLGTLMWTSRYVYPLFLFYAFGFEVNILMMIIALNIAQVIGMLSFLPGGMGIQEPVMISLFLAFGIDPTIAAIVTVMDRAIFYFYALVVGYISFVYLNHKYG